MLDISVVKYLAWKQHLKLSEILVLCSHQCAGVGQNIKLVPVSAAFDRAKIRSLYIDLRNSVCTIDA